jgi:RNA polymerase sigma-70 factor (ECF subfamily)
MSERTLRLDPEGWDGDSLSITASRSVVGRGSDADVLVAEPSISREHAVIHLGEKGWEIEDAGSSQGTGVNWMKIDNGERIRLDSGDRVEFGGMAYLVELLGDPFIRPKPPERPKRISHGSVSAAEFKTRGTLLLRLKEGDTLAQEVSWEDFYKVYSPIIAGFARRAGCPGSEVDDIVHEVMAGFFKAAHRFEYDPKMGRFRGYLKTATLNAIRQRYRKNRGKTTFDPAWLEQQPGRTETLWAREWLGQLIIRALDAVREGTSIEQRSWDAFELYGRRNVPIDEVAQRLEMAPAAIRKAKSRISQLVRDEIERLRLEEG